MCKPLPASALAFSLYEACPFELPPVDQSALTVTAPADDSGAALPVFMGVPAQYCRVPLAFEVRSEFSAFDDFDCWSLDAPDSVPVGSVRAGPVYGAPGDSFCFGRATGPR